MRGLKIRFPVIETAPWCLYTKGPAILLSMEPIAPAHLMRDPDPHCKVVGQLQNGRKVEFTIPLHVWQEAIKTAPLFVSVPHDSTGGALGLLYDANGQPLRKALQ